MRDAFSTPRNRIITILVLVLFVLLVVATLVIGIDDNALGLSLALLSGATLVVAFTHAWRTSARFKRFLLVVVITLGIFLVVGIPLSILVDLVTMPAWLSAFLGAVATTLLFGIVFLCIPGLVVGIIGTVVTRRRERVLPTRDQEV